MNENDGVGAGQTETGWRIFRHGTTAQRPRLFNEQGR